VKASRVGPKFLQNNLQRGDARLNPDFASGSFLAPTLPAIPGEKLSEDSVNLVEKANC
jgi:hypothetical protein